jgi:hypothetical protein
MEAFAGLHNLGKRIVVIFDEASQIDDVIWNTTDGIFTDADTEVLFAVFGNPTRGQGAFFECFNRFRHRWLGRQIDSRKVPISDKKMIQEWIDDYGIDSDYVRMNVLGQFPRVSSMQFIANDVVAAARNREVSAHITDALIMGVDVARFGDDESVIAFRKGRDARSIPWLKFRKLDTMALASAVAEAHERLKADACFVDGGGVGGGVVDRLRSLGFTVRDVQFGAAPDRADVDKDATRYANKRAEIWGYMRESLPGLAIPDDDALAADLTNVLYGFKDGTKGAAIVLEKKEHMKKRGMASPDRADALALTYAYPVMPRGWAGGEHRMHMTDNRHQAQIDYDPLA